MNERIKELAEEASHQSPDGYPVTIPYSKDFAKKFAELIVRDCCSIVMDDKVISWADSIRISKTIKEEFGVEE